MQDPEHGNNFWLGNGLLALALLILLFIGPLWERLGVGAMALWIGVAATGAYFMMKGEGGGKGK